MEKYAVLELVSPYLHAVGRVVRTTGAQDDAGSPAPPPPPPRASRLGGSASEASIRASDSEPNLRMYGSTMGMDPSASHASATATAAAADGGGMHSAQEELGSAALTDNLGSCVYVSRQDRSRAFIITTSFVLATRREAAEAEAIFFEQRVLSAGIKNVPSKPVRVQLRPDRLFFTSAPDAITRMTPQQRRLHAGSVGYTVVACEVEGRGDNIDNNSTLAVRPLTLPILPSSIPPICVGDLHLVLSHVDGIERRAHGFTIEECFDGHSAYSTSDLATTFASGGPVFDKNGDFIGLHHEFGDENVVIHIGAVVKHLYHSLVLGRIGLPIVSASAEGSYTPCEHDGSVTGVETLGKVERYPYGNGSVVQDLTQLQYEDKRKNAKVRQTLVMRTHREIFEELYDADNYETLVFMLHAFHSRPLLLKLVLDKLLSHGHRGSLPELARLGGVGILLEALASNRTYDVPLVTLGATLIGRMSLFDDNREALSRYGGVQTTLSMLQDYINSPEVVQWGVYTLLNLVQPDCARAKDNVSLITQYSGIRTLLAALKKYPEERHLTRWGTLAVAHLVEDNKASFDLAIDANVCTIVFDALKRHGTTDVLVAYGITACLANLVAHEAFFAATEYFVVAGVIPVLATLLREHRSCSEPFVLIKAVAALECLLTGVPGSIEEAVANDMEALLSDVALSNMAETGLHESVARVLRLLGVDDPSAAHPHLQLPGSG